MSEVSYNDLYRRVEKVEIDVAVLDSKTNRLHQDLIEIKRDTKSNGEIARRTNTLVIAVPTTLSLIFGLVIFIERMLT